MPELMEYLKAGTTKGGTDREREAGEKLHGTLQELNDFLTERTSNMDQGAPFFGGK